MCMSKYTCIHVYAYTCIHVCMYICIYICYIKRLKLWDRWWAGHIKRSQQPVHENFCCSAVVASGFPCFVVDSYFCTFGSASGRSKQLSIAPLEPPKVLGDLSERCLVTSISGIKLGLCGYSPPMAHMDGYVRFYGYEPDYHKPQHLQNGFQGSPYLN